MVLGESIHVVNTICYILIGVMSVLMYTKFKEETTSVALGSLAIHGLVFNAFYLFRALTWETCPPFCGLQDWAIIIRLHALLAILTVMSYRIYVKRP